jgi:hypothetical protein
MKIPRQRKSNHNRRKYRISIILQAIEWSIQLEKQMGSIKYYQK